MGLRSAGGITVHIGGEVWHFNACYNILAWSYTRPKGSGDMAIHHLRLYMSWG